MKSHTARPLALLMLLGVVCGLGLMSWSAGPLAGALPASALSPLECSLAGMALVLASAVGLTVLGSHPPTPASDTRVARPAGGGIDIIQLQQWSAQIGMLVLVALTVSLLVWPASTWLRDLNPLAELLLWLLVFVGLLASLVLFSRLLLRLPAMQRANRACAARLLQHWVPRLPELLEPGETALGAIHAPMLDYAGCGHGWINALLLWTNQRLLLVPARPRAQVTPIWALARGDVAMIRVGTVRSGWLRWLWGPIEQIEVTERNGRRSGIVAANPGDCAGIMAELLRTTLDRRRHDDRFPG